MTHFFLSQPNESPKSSNIFVTMSNAFTHRIRWKSSNILCCRNNKFKLNLFSNHHGNFIISKLKWMETMNEWERKPQFRMSNRIESPQLHKVHAHTPLRFIFIRIHRIWHSHEGSRICTLKWFRSKFEPFKFRTIYHRYQYLPGRPQLNEKFSQNRLQYWDLEMWTRSIMKFCNVLLVAVASKTIKPFQNTY